jgi:hypothetical protein
MALPGLSKSPVATAASLLVALAGFAAVAATPGFTVTEFIQKTKTTTTQTASLAPNDTATITAKVTRSNPDETRPGTLTLAFTLPSAVDFVEFSGCTEVKSATTPTCTITDPFAFDQTANNGVGAFGTEVSATITVSRHFDETATTCDTTDLGVVTVHATTDAGDAADQSGSAVTLGADPYADIAVTATAPANANRGDTISLTGTVKNLGPCPATNLEIDPESADAAGVNLLTFQSISGGCTATSTTKDAPCMIASLAPGATVNITKTYKVDDVSVQNSNQTQRTSGLAYAGSDVADPNSSNDVADTATVVPSDSGGCSTGGAVGPIALLGLMFFLRKRRTA